MEKYNTCSYDRYWPVLTDMWPGTGFGLFYTGLGAGTSHSGHSGRYRNEIYNYARDPTRQPQEEERGTTASTARRRRGLRPGQWHHGDHLDLANSTVHTRWPMELGGPVTAVHGGTVAHVTAGRPTPTREREEEGCSSTGEPRRTKCAC
jgi:hypothetical protein